MDTLRFDRQMTTVASMRRIVRHHLALARTTLLKTDTAVIATATIAMRNLVPPVDLNLPLPTPLHPTPTTLHPTPTTLPLLHSPPLSPPTTLLCQALLRLQEPPLIATTDRAVRRRHRRQVLITAIPANASVAISVTISVTTSVIT